MIFVWMYLKRGNFTHQKSTEIVPFRKKHQKAFIILQTKANSIKCRFNMCCSIEHQHNYMKYVAEMFPFFMLGSLFRVFYLDVNLFIGLSAIVIIKESNEHHFG